LYAMPDAMMPLFMMPPLFDIIFAFILMPLPPMMLPITLIFC